MQRFPPSFLERVQRLAQGLGLPGTALHGGRERRGVGDGLVFEDHRAYAPGDDPRSIDWNATARLGEPFVTRRRREESRRLTLVVDATPSMDFGEPSKLDVALRLAGAFGVLGVRSGARVEVAWYGGASPPVLTVERWVQAGAFLETLDTVRAGEPAADPARLLRPVLRARRARRGVVVLTDAYELEGWLRVLEDLRVAGHQPVLWQIFAPQEVHPPLAGRVRFVDAEGGGTRDLAWDEATRRVYQHQVERFLSALEHGCARHGVVWRAHVTDRDELAALGAFLRRPRGTP